MKVHRSLAAAVALASLLALFLFIQGEREQEAARQALARTTGTEKRSEQEWSATPDKATPVDLEVRNEAGRTVVSDRPQPERESPAELGPNQLALTLFGPEGTPFEDFIRSLQFSYDPYIEMRAIEEPHRVAVAGIGGLPRGDALHIVGKRASELDDDGLVGTFSLEPNHVAFCVEWILEGRVLQVQEVPAESFDRVRFEASETEIENQFGSISAKVKGDAHEGVLEGSIETRTQHSQVKAKLDHLGNATLRGLPAGEYEVTATAHGFHHDVEVLHLLPGEHRELSFDLSRARSISGRIVGGDDEIGNRQVALRRVSRGADIELGLPSIVDSDDVGNFVFPEVRPGEWVVRVIRRRNYRKMLHYPPKFGDDAETWTPSGKLEGEHHGGIRTYLFRLEDQRESNWLAVDTRNGSIDEVELRLETPIDVTFRCDSEEKVPANIELIDTNGYPITEFPVGAGAERVFLALPGDLVVRTKRGDVFHGEERFYPVSGHVIELPH